ncbi:NDUB9 dehydrogenase, partial [Rhinopomastus cyanomelas]|nr:NDUB9 dehydrogenase [Rhinopomastus cyanomelas]
QALTHMAELHLCRDKYRYFACLLRERFEKNKDVRDMVRATELLKAGEDEFWANQHPQPYGFSDSLGGTSYERHECYRVRPPRAWLCRGSAWESFKGALTGLCLDSAVHLTVACEALPPACKEGHLPPLWWQYVTRPHETPM